MATPLFVGTSFPPNLPSTVGVATQGVATGQCPGRRVVYLNGLFWVWWFNGRMHGFSTSEDGDTWSSFTPVASGSIEAGLSIWSDGRRIYYARADGKRNPIVYYRWGIANEDGTISWDIPEGSFTTNNNCTGHFHCVYASSSSNVWVTVPTAGRTNDHVEVWAYTDGMWFNKRDVTCAGTGPNGGNAYSVLSATTSGYVLVYVYDLQGTIRVESSPDGEVWTEPISPPSYYDNDGWAVRSLGDIVYFVGREAGMSQRILFWSTAYPCNSTSGETIIDDRRPFNGAGISAGGRTIAISYEADDGRTFYVRRSDDLGASWGTTTIVADFEKAKNSKSLTSTADLPLVLQTDNVLLAWSSGNEPVVNVRFLAYPLNPVIYRRLLDI